MELQVEVTKDVSVYQSLTRLCEEISVDLYNDSLSKTKVVKYLKPLVFRKLLFFKHVLQNGGKDMESNVGFLMGDIYLEIHIIRQKKHSLWTIEKDENLIKTLEMVEQVAEQDSGIASVLQLLLLLADTKVDDENDEMPILGLDLRRYESGEWLKRSRGPFSILPDSAFELPDSVNKNLCPFIPQYKNNKSFNFTYLFEDEPGTGLSDYFWTDSINMSGPFYKELNEEEFNSQKWKFPSTDIKLLYRTSSHMDEGYVTPDDDHLYEIEPCRKVIDYWDGRHLEPCSSFRTWEQLGLKDAEPEKEFVTQSKTSLLHLWWILKRKFFDPCEEFRICSTILTEVTIEILDRDIKFLLIAIESDTFYYSEESNSFELQQGVYISGITPETLQHYCQEYIRCANNYLMLTKLINQDYSKQNNYKQGLIFSTLCSCIQHHIQCYRGIIPRLKLSNGFVRTNHQIVTLRSQLEFLVKFCCVFLSEDSEPLPHGGFLLVYIYDKVSEVVRKDLAHLLYYILESCCLVYFRILEKWIFEGVCDDQYEEFFIKATPASKISYNRLFWTQGFQLNRQLVPGFLRGLENDLFICGKSVSLLKLSNVNDPLMGCIKQGYPGVHCCLDQDGLDHVFSECSEYNDRCVAKCGSRPRVICPLTEEEQEAYRLSITKQREKTFDLIKKVQEDNRKLKSAHKHQVFEELKKNMEDERARKIQARNSQLNEDKKMMEIAMALEQAENLRRDEERVKLEEYYKTLSSIAEKKRLKPEWKLKRMAFSEVRTQFLRDESKSLNEISVLKNKPGDSDKNVTVNENPEFGSGIEHSLDSNKPIHSDPKTTSSNCAGDAPCVEFSNINTETTESSANQNTILQSEINKKKVLQEEFGIIQCKKIPTDKDVQPSKSETNLAIDRKKSEKEERIQKEWKGLEAVMFDADEARQKAIKNREKMYGGEYDIITGEHRHARLEYNIEKNVAVNSTEQNVEDTTSNVKTVDSMHLLEDMPNEIIEIPKITNIMYNSLQQQSLHTNHYKNIYEIDKQPVTTDIADSILPVVKETRKLDVEQIGFTKIYSCLKKSVLFPLQTQLKLVNDALLRLFINEHKLVTHLDCIRKYFFLIDGDYACNLTKNLFSEMRTVKRPSSLLNHLRLNSLLRTAVGNNSIEDLSERLSFLVNKVPTSFCLTDPNVITCLSLTYKIHWPLNVIITPQTVSKYNEVFTFLMQLRQASWALEQDIHLLKSAVNKTSFQYRQVQLFRHVMTQFIRAFHNYIMTTVIDQSWLEFKNELDKASTLETLYVTHVSYIKKVMFRCLLNQDSKSIHKHLMDLLHIILTFHESLYSDDWTEDPEGVFKHPAYPRLCHQYRQFTKLSQFLFSYLERLVISGYQPHFEQLITLLSYNNFYKTKS